MTAKNINCSSSCPTFMNKYVTCKKLNKAYIARVQGQFCEHIYQEWSDDKNCEVDPNHHDIVRRNYSIIRPGRVSIFSTRIIRNLCHMRRVLVSSKFLQAFVPKIARAFHPDWTCYRCIDQIWAASLPDYTTRKISAVQISRL